MKVRPSPSVERAKQMMKDPDRYFAKARKLAEQQVRAEREARRKARRSLTRTTRRLPGESGAAAS